MSARLEFAVMLVGVLFALTVLGVLIGRWVAAWTYHRAIERLRRERAAIREDIDHDELRVLIADDANEEMGV